MVCFDEVAVNIKVIRVNLEFLVDSGEYGTTKFSGSM